MISRREGRRNARVVDVGPRRRERRLRFVAPLLGLRLLRRRLLHDLVQILPSKVRRPGQHKGAERSHTSERRSLDLSSESLQVSPYSQRVHLELSVRVWGPTSGAHLSSSRSRTANAFLDSLDRYTLELKYH